MKTGPQESMVAPPAAKLAMNRRRRQRMSIHVPVRIYCPSEGYDHYHLGTCINISDDGMAFETKAVLDLTQMVEIEFHQPGYPVFRREAGLLYRMGGRYGAYFADLR